MTAAQAFRLIGGLIICGMVGAVVMTIIFKVLLYGIFVAVGGAIVAAGALGFWLNGRHRE